MRRLGIFLASNLRDLTEMRSMHNLVALQLEGCWRISDASDFENCLSLRFLNLAECGDISSVAPVRNLVNLDSLYLFGDTRVLDGDLTPVLDLPMLKDFRMQNRRHYKPSVADIERRILEREPD